MALLYIISPGKDSFLLRFPAWYPRGPEHNADEAHQVHQEADTPAAVCQKALSNFKKQKKCADPVWTYAFLLLNVTMLAPHLRKSQMDFKSFRFFTLLRSSAPLFIRAECSYISPSPLTVREIKSCTLVTMVVAERLPRSSSLFTTNSSASTVYRKTGRTVPSSVTV